MDQVTHNKIVSFIWGIPDDVLRDLFNRGKYQDVILPMCVIRNRVETAPPVVAKVHKPGKAKATRMRQYFDPSRAEPEVSPAITQIRGNARLCVERVDELLTGEAA